MKRVRQLPHPFAIIFIGYMLSLALVLVMTITFFKAYFNNYQTVVHVNLYGEGLFEFILIPVVLTIIIIGLVKTVYYLRYDVEVVHEI